MNGWETTFELPGSPDEVLHHFDRGTPCRLRLQLPPGLIRRGTNTIELSIRQGSWVLYDAMELVRQAGS